MASPVGSVAPSPWQRFHGPGSIGLRSEAERDRDRILYSSAFQRLVGITQVASPETGAGFHNRLTHSIKVAQVGRRLAQALKARNEKHSSPVRLIAALDEDTVEASCLGHDLGHPPFGHVAETELNSLAKSWGGFEGNAQSFRILTALALRDLNFAGLNLTRATLNGVLKYPWRQDVTDSKKKSKWGVYASELAVFDWVREGSRADERALEAELMDWADDVTYAVHDLEDFYRVGLVPLDLLASDPLELQRFRSGLFERDNESEPPEKAPRPKFGKQLLDDTVEFLLGREGLAAASHYRGSVVDRVTTRARSSTLIDRYINAVEIGSGRRTPIRIAKEYKAEVAVLKELTWFYVIRRPSLETLHRGQRAVIRRLHRIYCSAATAGELSIFPEAQRDQLRETPDDLRVVTDFVSGLTEEMAYELHHRLTGESKGSILDAAGRSFT